MSDNSKIEWTDHTFNPWEGCQAVAAECDNCYAEARDKRFTGGTHWGPKAPRRRTSAQNWNKPRKWHRNAEAFFAEHGRRQRVFCASLADVFDNAVDPQWRSDLFDLIRECDGMDWLLLTKRPQNIAKMLPEDWGNGWPHVWLGTSAGTQKTADQNIPPLLAVPAAVRFVSAEPLLGPVNLRELQSGWWCVSALDGYQFHDTDRSAPSQKCAKLDWVICGGESGPRARPMHPDSARALRDQCQAAGTAFFFKQWGEWSPVTIDKEDDGTLTPAYPDPENNECAGAHRAQQQCVFWQGGDLVQWPRLEDLPARGARCIGKHAAGRLLDGQTWDEFPPSAAR